MTVSNFAPPGRRIDADAALRLIAEGTAAATGTGFFRALVYNLARALDTSGAWVTEYLPEQRRLRAMALWLGGQWVEGLEHDIDGTPCEAVIDDRQLVHIPDNILQLYPDKPLLRAAEAVSYLGVPLLDGENNVMGHLAVLDRRPMARDEQLLAVFRIFASRAAAEMQRLSVEQRLGDREQKLGRLIDSAMDAIIDLDCACRVAVANAAAERVFRCPARHLIGKPIAELMTPTGHRKLLDLSDQLKAEGPGWGALFVPGSLEARRSDGEVFAADATLSRYELHGRPCHTLILRDVGERVAAERRIEALTAQAQYLQEELRALHNSDQILGASAAMREVMRAIGQVAPTDATVLVLGETGTGKELVARAVHAAGRRRNKPLIRVNCAAIPANLIESEFFGHEKGAFTGATQKRDGRFALADGGTLFLDEVGELPIDLQVKLLRALQEGEFEPVGSSRTIRVNVRVVAATNRDLPAAIRAGRFREDLYYRLNVFPIRVPPLRERGEDVELLAREFARRAAQRIGRAPVTLTEQGLVRLRAYAWPGNVRELENVIERAVITAEGDRLDLARALPDVGATDPGPGPAAGAGGNRPLVRTAAELAAIEKDNIRRALETTQWRIAGAGGASELLGIKPSTLRSRIKSFGIARGA